MTKQTHGKLNQLERLLPEGLLVDAAWLSRHGYSTGLRSQYVAAGWLQQPVRRVYQRPRGPLGWQQVVISLQTLLARDLVVGGRTALELHGFAHYLQQQTDQRHSLRTRQAADLAAGSRRRRALRLPQRRPAVSQATRRRRRRTGSTPKPGRIPEADSIVVQPWGPWNWPLMLSAPERAILEVARRAPRSGDASIRPTC